MRCSVIFALLVLSPALGIAQPSSPPTSRTGSYSPYEQETIQNTLSLLNAKMDPSPEGKVIEGIDVVSLDVIEPRDPAPGFLNQFHAKTRRYVMEREVLLHVGGRYQQVLVDETARNLRAFSQISLVVCIAVQGGTPDRVRMIVISKDVWSLRLNSDFAYTPGGIEKLLLQPTETNLLGTRQTVAGRFELYPKSYALGLSYGIPRIAGSRVAFSAAANLIWNRQRAELEGSFGSLYLGQPLYSTLAEWSWAVNASWRHEVTRRYINAHLASYVARDTPEQGAIPYQYHTEQISNSYEVTRSFGWAIKNDLSSGVEVSRNFYKTFDLSVFNPLAAAEFQNTKVPVSDTRVGPFLQYHAYTTNFSRVLDFETLGLQEDFRLGHDLYFKLYPVMTAFGSSRSFFGVYTAAQYTWPLGDGLIRIAVESTTEAQVSQIADGSVDADMRIATPRLGFGRLVFDAGMLHRYRNYLRANSFLGGGDRLRGYPTNYFVGKDWVSYNLEFRTRPMEILACQLGAAAFYDVGDAFDGLDALRLKESVGVGLRALFPQLERIVMRADIGFPVGYGSSQPGVSPISFFVTFGQAFPMPYIAP